MSFKTSSKVIGPQQLRIALCTGWMLFVAGSYAAMIPKLSTHQLERFLDAADDFFLWQCVGFLLLTLLCSVARPALLGRAAAVYWALSTVALLSLSQELWLPFQLTLFAVWCVLATSSCYRWIERFVGLDHATPAMALCLLYALTIPLSFFLSLFKLLSFWPVALIALALAMPGAARLTAWRQTGRSFLTHLDRLDAIGVAALQAGWVSLAIAFVWATGPEALSDSIRSYLPEIQALARQQGFEPQFIDVGRFLPRTLQAVGAAFYVLGSYSVVKWFSWLATVALAILVMEEIARRSGRLNLAAVGAAATLACPILLKLSTSLMFDHVMTYFCVAIFVSLSRALQARSARAVFLSAFLVGCAVQIKYNFLIFAFIWLLGLLLFAFKTFGVRQGLRWSLPPFLLSVAVGSPWFLYTLAIYGNPVFPFFNELLKSPYWPAGMSTSLNIGKFQLDGALDYLFFPWIATFQTSRINHGPDGSIGFQFLTFLPFLLTLRRRAWQSGLDLGVAGAAVIVGILISTPYARYWLPGYPLLLIPLFVAAGSCFESMDRQLPRWLSPITGLTVLTGLLLHLPFWTASFDVFPWPNYTKTVSEQAWQTRSFQGFPAIERFNEIVEPDDRVLVTDYQAVHTIPANAFEFPFWHCMATVDEQIYSINGIRSAEELESYFKRHSIKYWVVDFSRGHFSIFDYHFDTDQRYWTAPRLISGSGGLAVFEVTPQVAHRRYRSTEQRSLLPALVPKVPPRRLLTDREGWQDRYQNRPDRASHLVDGKIQMPMRGTISHLFSVPPNMAMFRARAYLESTDSVSGTHLSVDWLDASGEALTSITHRSRIPWPEDWLHLFGEIPETAKYGRLKVTRWGSKPLSIGQTELEFLSLNAP